MDRLAHFRENSWKVIRPAAGAPARFCAQTPIDRPSGSLEPLPNPTPSFEPGLDCAHSTPRQYRSSARTPTRKPSSRVSRQHHQQRYSFPPCICLQELFTTSKPLDPAIIIACLGVFYILFPITSPVCNNPAFLAFGTYSLPIESIHLMY